MTDFLDEKRREITDRLKELKPLVDEYNRLEAAASALQGVGGSGCSADGKTATRRRGPGRPRGSSQSQSRESSTRTTARATRNRRSTPTKRRAGRRKGSGTRAAQALAFVQGQPGITIPELAAKMGIKQNYLYRVLPGLEQEKKVTQAGPRLAPQGPSASRATLTAVAAGHTSREPECASSTGSVRRRGERRRALSTLRQTASTVSVGARERSDLRSAPAPRPCRARRRAPPPRRRSCARENSSISRPCTIFHSPSAHVQGKPQMSPSGTP